MTADPLHTAFGIISMGPIKTRCASAFTLVELLVVVAIIAVLIAMMLPSLMAARKTATTTVCGSQLHQLGIANETYFATNKVYPGHKWLQPDGSKAYWPLAIGRYLRSDEIQRCPAVPDWVVGRHNSYGYNYKYLGSLRQNDQSPTAPFEHFPVRDVRAPGTTIAYADSDGTGWTKPYNPDPDGLDPEPVGFHGYTLDPTYIPRYSLRSLNSDGIPDPYAFRTHRSYISIRHQGIANAVWADGHAAKITPRLVYEDNRFWNGLGREDTRLDDHVESKTAEGRPFRYASQLGP